MEAAATESQTDLDHSGSPIDRRAIEHELNLITLSRMPVTMGAALVAALLVPLVLAGTRWFGLVLIWSFLLIVTGVWRWWLSERLRDKPTAEVARGLNFIFFQAALIGASWVLIGLVTPQPYLYPLSLMVVLMVGGAASAYASAPRFHHAFAWPVIGTLAIRFALSDLGYGYAIALFMVVFLLGTGYIVTQNYRSLRDVVSDRMRSDQLAEALRVLNREHRGELDTRRRTQRALMARDEVLHEMYRAVSDHEVDYSTRLERLLALGCDHFGMRLGSVLTQAGDEVRVEALRRQSPEDAVDHATLASVCQLVLERGVAVVSADLERLPKVRTRLAATLGSLAASPIDNRQHRGVVCFLDREPRDELSKFDQDLLEILSNWIALEVGRQRIIEDLRNSEQEMRSLADVLPFNVAYVDRDLNYQFVNRAMAEASGQNPQALLGQSLRQRVGEPMFRKLSDRITGALWGERQDFEVQESSVEPAIDYRVTYLPDLRHGEVVGFYQVLLDITQAKREAEQLQHKATHDALTELPNRIELQYQIQQLIDRRGVAGPHALCYIDLDNFKPINDSLGHHAGDAALQWFAMRMLSVARSSDVVARVGGDEFAILLPGCSGNLARRITDGLHALLAAAPFEFEGSMFSLQTSIGVIEFRGGQSHPEALLSKADAVCYRAKQAGGGHTA